MSRAEAFRTRVRIERKIIGHVNLRFSNSNLHGLSPEAITRWLEIAQEKNDVLFVLEVGEALLSLSRRLRLEADTSSTVFEEDAEKTISNIDAELESISKLLEKLKC